MNSHLRILRELLKPHSKAIAAGLVAAIGEGIANLLEPWPLKLVLDNVLRGRSSHASLESLDTRLNRPRSADHPLIRRAGGPGDRDCGRDLFLHPEILHDPHRPMGHARPAKPAVLPDAAPLALLPR